MITLTINGDTLSPDALGMVLTSTQRVDDEHEASIYGLPIGEFAQVEVQHRYAELLAYDDALLARWSIVRAEVADPPPPPAPRAELPKDVVTQRLIDIGKASAVMTALRADDGQYALWFAPSWPNVYKDDERVIGLLQVAGLTAEEIAAVLA